MVLSELKHDIQRGLGYRFEEVDFKEKLIYSIVSNSDLFGSSMMRYKEKQLFKKCLDVIEITPIGQLDASLKQDFSFTPDF
jgi:hypothetical protein